MSTLAAASTASSSSTSSPRCVPFVFRRGGGARGRLPPAPATGAARTATRSGAPTAGGCGRPLCRAAGVVGEGVQSAFFVSLDGCNCVKVRTNSFKESESEEAAVPLMPPPPRAHDDSRSSSAATARTGGRRRASAGGKPRRGGLGCCTPAPQH